MVEDVKKLYGDAKSYYDSGDMEKATEKFALFLKEGKERLKKTMDRWYEDREILGAESLFKVTESWFEEGGAWLSAGKDWVARVKRDSKTGKESDKIRHRFAEAWYYWGFSLAGLARIEKRNGFCENARELFKRAIEKYDAAIGLGWNDAGRARVFKGAACYRMSLVFGEGVSGDELAEKKKYEEEAKKCFMESERFVLDILVALDYDVEEELVKSGILCDLLGDKRSKDGTFFTATVKDGIERDTLQAYKEVYIRSLYIISRLYVDNVYENEVASYREMRASRFLLDGDGTGANRFRLTAIDYSNDPKEGEVLIDSLVKNSTVNPSVEDYGIFAGCFTFNRDNLNMFRLYGKGSGEEGTGLSLVFDSSFFAERLMLPSDADDSDVVGKKLTLFRCIYFNPQNDRVESVGRLDSEHFDNNQCAAKERYDAIMENIIKEVDDDIRKLRDEITNKNLKKDVVNQLLINLRYLVKSSCFKEEQECRIVKIYHLKNDAKKIDLDGNCNLCVYYAPKVSDYVKSICFGPKAVETERFKDFLKYKELDRITCTQSAWKLA